MTERDVEIRAVFNAVLRKRPLSPMPHFETAPPLDWLNERGRRYRHIRDVVCAELQASGLTARIVGGGTDVEIPAPDLRKADANCLAGDGTLSTELWALRAYRAHSGWVFLPAKVAASAQRRALEELGANGKRGRPSQQDEVRAAYWARFPDGHEAEGMSWKAGIREIDATCSIDTLKRALGRKA